MESPCMLLVSSKCCCLVHQIAVCFDSYMDLLISFRQSAVPIFAIAYWRLELAYYADLSPMEVEDVQFRQVLGCADSPPSVFSCCITVSYSEECQHQLQYRFVNYWRSHWGLWDGYWMVVRHGWSTSGAVLKTMKWRMTLLMSASNFGSVEQCTNLHHMMKWMVCSYLFFICQLVLLQGWAKSDDWNFLLYCLHLTTVH